MPRVKIDYIVSFSSEDPDNPASNLLAWDVNKKKWLCSKGEASCSVVLQLNKAVKICSVNIGAHQSALIEVLVGRSETPNEPFQVLVPSSVFQSPSEARREAAGDADKVRSFAADALAAARSQRWDRLRVVCSQPYNKHCKFGLSFIHVFSEEDLPPAPPAAAVLPSRLSAALDLQSSDEDEFRPGELFAKHLQKPKDVPDTGAQIRQATSHALRNIPDSSIKLTKTTITKTSESKRRESLPPRTDDERASDRRRASLLYTADDDGPNHKVDRVLDRHRDHKREQDKTNKHKDKRNYSHNKLPDATRSQTKHDLPHNQDGPTNRDNDDSSKRKHDGHSSNGRKNGRPSGDASTDDRPSTNSRKDGRPSADAKKDDGASCNGRKGDHESETRKRQHSDNMGSAPAPGGAPGGALRAGPVSTAPHTLLADVVFVLSGYENPRRARLRTAALALGAACRRDWGPDCTHLICAFPNTPKLRAVRSAANGACALVVRGEWVEESARTRRRLPCQWFATEPRHHVPPPPAWEACAAPEDPSSESDTDDEIERVRQKMKQQRAATPPPVSPGSDVTFVRDERLQGSVTVVDSDSCGGSTDEEAGGACSPRASSPCGRLPSLFAGRCFSVRASTELRARLLERYLRAYGGLVLQESDGEAEYVVCDSEWSGGGGCAGAVAVRAAWLWRCHAERRLCSPDAYTLTSNTP